MKPLKKSNTQKQSGRVVTTCGSGGNGEVLAKGHSTAVTEDEDVSSPHVQRPIMNNTGLNTGNL